MEPETLQQIHSQSQEAFKGISGTKSGVSLEADEHLIMALVGKPKTGKSWMAATMPQPVLIYDFDGRAASIATHKMEIRAGLQIKTLQDPTQHNPTVFQALEADLSILKDRKRQGLPIPASFVFDSVTYLKRYTENMLFKQGLASRSIKVSPATNLILSKNWDAVNGVEGAFNYLITEYSALGNICFVFHEKNEKDYTESKPEQAAYTDQFTTDPQYLAKLLSRFNEVYRIQIDSAQKYIVTCRPKFEFTASTTLLIDATEPPDISLLLKKHRERLATANKTKP